MLVTISHYPPALHNQLKTMQLQSIYSTTGIPFFYIIEHIQPKIYYAGVKYGKCQKLKRSTDSSIFMTESGYHTSSKDIRNIIAKEGLSAFKIRKIHHFQTPEEALEYETRFLHKIDAKNNPNWYNQHNGDGKFRHKGGFKHTEETKAHLSLAHTGKIFSKEHKKNLSKSKQNITLETKAKMSKAHLGSILSEETKKNMSKVRKGLLWYNNGLIIRRFYKGKEEAGFLPGRPWHLR